MAPIHGGAVSALRVFILALLSAIVLALAGFAGVAHAGDDFLPPEQAFVMSAAMSGPDQLDVHFKIASQYYMYRERFEFAFEPQGEQTLPPVFPKGLVKYDPTFEKDLEVYYDQLTVRIPLPANTPEGGAPAHTPLALNITSQGCADAGLCYPPMTSQLTLKSGPDGYQVEGQGVAASVPPPLSQDALRRATMGASPGAGGAGPGFSGALALGDTGFAHYLANAGWFQILALSAVLGVLLSFTPCVLPMVPILLALLAGDTGANAGRKPTRWRGLSLAAVYVLGMSLVYTALGVAAGMIGASMSIWLQTPWVLGLFAGLLALLALATFDVFTLQAPTAMQSALNQRLSRIPGGRYGGVFLMGMLSALIVGPCVAAPLAGVLLFISQTGDLVLGGSALFALAWGEGLLLLVVGATSGALLPKAGPWMEGVRRVFGIMLLATALWMVNSVLPEWLLILGWVFLALWSAVMLGAFQSIAAGAGLLRSVSRAVGLIFAFWAILLLVGLASGGRDLLHPLAPFTAQNAVAPGMAYAPAANADSRTVAALPGAGVLNNVLTAPAATPGFTIVGSPDELDAILASADQPVMLDFYADWCVSCIEMEKFTFSDPAVARHMGQMMLIQADVTRNTPADRALLKRFSLFGPPGIIFFDKTGRQLADARVIGFKNAQQFSAILEGVLSGQTN